MNANLMFVCVWMCFCSHKKKTTKERTLLEMIFKVHFRHRIAFVPVIWLCSKVRLCWCIIYTKRWIRKREKKSFKRYGIAVRLLAISWFYSLTVCQIYIDMQAITLFCSPICRALPRLWHRFGAKRKTIESKWFLGKMFNIPYAQTTEKMT